MVTRLMCMGRGGHHNMGAHRLSNLVQSRHFSCGRFPIVSQSCLRYWTPRFSCNIQSAFPLCNIRFAFPCSMHPAVPLTPSVSCENEPFDAELTQCVPPSRVTDQIAALMLGFVQILDFLLSRPEVSKVTWNSKEFLPPTDAQEL